MVEEFLKCVETSQYANISPLGAICGRFQLFSDGSTNLQGLRTAVVRVMDQTEPVFHSIPQLQCINRRLRRERRNRKKAFFFLFFKIKTIYCIVLLFWMLLLHFSSPGWDLCSHCIFESVFCGGQHVSSLYTSLGHVLSVCLWDQRVSSAVLVGFVDVNINTNRGGGGYGLPLIVPF